jgi:hypothetical protein
MRYVRRKQMYLKMSRQAIGQPERHNKLAEVKCNDGDWYVIRRIGSNTQREHGSTIFRVNVQLMLFLRTELSICEF